MLDGHFKMIPNHENDLQLEHHRLLNGVAGAIGQAAVRLVDRIRVQIRPKRQEQESAFPELIF